MDSRIVAAVDCTSSATFGPAEVSYYAYLDAVAMQVGFDALAGNLPEGDCARGNTRGRWTHLDIERGSLACYESRIGETTALWGDEETAVLALAHDSTLTTDEMFTWWQDHAALAR